MSQAGAPLDNQTPTMISGCDIGPFVVTHSYVMAAPTTDADPADLGVLMVHGLG